MIINSLELKHFRSHSSSYFDFSEYVNIIVGPNASGKTNLLEAVLSLCQGSSYRAKDVDLIEFKKPWARIDSKLDHQKRSVKIERIDDTATKTFLIDDKPYKRLSFDNTLPVVVFEPNHLMLLSRGPDQRRDYLDELIIRTNSQQKAIVNRYRRVLAQRNSLLKQPKDRALKQIFVWNIRLSELGEQIAHARNNLVNEINKSISEKYSKIAGQKTTIELVYEAHFPVDSYGSKMIAKLEKSTELDFLRGFTAYGPHREDITFKINGQPLALAASRGETRSLLLALKMFELELIEKTRKQKPLFLLDDVFSDLDVSRRKALVEILNKYQSILTTTEADSIKKFFKPSHLQLIDLG